MRLELWGGAGFHLDFPGVEISSAGGVWEMVRANSCDRFLFHFSFIIFLFKSYVHCFYGTRNDMHL